MSKAQNLKSKFRQSKVWKSFRKKISNKQDNLDPITKSKLRTGFHCHHLDLNSEHYRELIDDNFVCLNKLTHEMIHFAFTYYKKDTQFLDRLKLYLDRMVEINTN